VARHLSLSCDSCGKKEGPKVDIIPGVTRREDSARLTVDLCESCWAKLKKEFGFVQHEGTSRKSFKVYEDETNIPS